MRVSTRSARWSGLPRGPGRGRCCRDEKLARGRSLGADDTINYRTTPAWDAPARAMTGGKGVDHIPEVAGAATLPISLRALRDGGHLSLIGLLSGDRGEPDAAATRARGIRVDSVYVGSARHLADVAAACVRAGVRPVVDRVFPFDQARAAYQALERGEHFGKIVIRI